MTRQARSLDTLLAEVNAACPSRSTVSDGGIGDASHSSRESDHNPNPAGVWRARDFTNDPPHFDAAAFALSVAERLGKHPALGSGAYVIWNRRIISTDRLSEGWRPYTGSNPHDHHCHVSVATAASGYDSTAPWGVMKETDDMPFTEQQLREIIRTEVRPIVAEVLDADLNVHEPKGDPRFRGMTLRELLKKMATVTGTVPKVPGQKVKS